MDIEVLVIGLFFCVCVCVCIKFLWSAVTFASFALF